MPPATTISASPHLTAWAASTTAFRPLPQTLLIVSAGTLSGIPPRSDAWRAGFWPRPAPTTLPMITSSICSGFKPARATASRTTIAPSWVAASGARVPRNFPIGVRTAETMTGFSMRILRGQRRILAAGVGGKPAADRTRPLRFPWSAQAAGDLEQAPDARGEGRIERLVRGAPAPVPVRDPGHVHARLGAEAEQVLHGDDREVGDRGHRLAHDAPGDLLLASADVVQHVALRDRIERPEPPHRRVVVVRSRVDDDVAHEVVRRVVAVGRIETELEDTHSRKREIGPERDDVLGDVPQVFRHERRATDRPRDRIEQRATGTGLPGAPGRGRRTGGDGPVPDEAAEVIETERVVERELVCHARDPPGVPGRGEGVPAVDRVPPELPRLAEVVRRDAGDLHQPPSRVEPEHLLMRPHVRRVE